MRFVISIWWDFQSRNFDRAKITSWQGGLFVALERSRRIKINKGLETVVLIEPVCHPHLSYARIYQHESTGELLGLGSVLLDS